MDINRAKSLCNALRRTFCAVVKITKCSNHVLFLENKLHLNLIDFYGIYFVLF